MDVDTFFDRIRQNLIYLINRELTDLGSARVQRTAWIRLRQALKDDIRNIIGSDKVELPISSRIMDIYQGSDLNEIVNEMFAHMQRQIENPALVNSRFVFDEVLFLNVSFYQLNLTRDSSYIPLPSWIANKKAVINPKNENDEECFKWAVTVALHYKEIKSHAERVSNIVGCTNNYNWSGLEFSMAINKINEFEKNNDIAVIVLGVRGQRVYICRNSKHYDRKNVVNLLLIDDGEKRHYTAIKSFTRPLASNNSKHKHKQHFCLNCLQGFSLEESRDKHFEYCKNNEAVRIEMPEEGSFVEFHDGQNQFKVPFTMYANFEAIFKPMKESNFNPEESYSKEINQHIPSGFCVYIKFAYGDVENPLKLYRGEDCVEVFCDHVKNEAKRLYHVFPEKPMNRLTREEWKEFNKRGSTTYASKNLRKITPRSETTATTPDHIEDLPTGAAI